MAWPITLEANKVLLREGEESHSMYLLQEGQLKITKRTGDEEVLLGFIHSGELVGELSFLDQRPRSATVTAVTDCELIQIPLKVKEDVMKSTPKWMEAFIETLVVRIRQADEKIRI